MSPSGSPVHSTYRAAVLTLVLFGAACGRAQPAGSGATQISELPSNGGAPSVVRMTARGEALAAYRGMWNSFVAAARRPSGAHLELRTYATGQALKLVKSGLRQKAAAKVVTRGHLVLHPTIKSVSLAHDPRKITIVDCVDDTHWLEYTKVGEPASGRGEAGRHHTEALVETKGGRWRVTAWFIEKAGTC